MIFILRRVIFPLVVFAAFCACSWQGADEVCAAPKEPPTVNIPAGGKGKTEEQALVNLRQAALQKVLVRLTAWSDDPASPYQILSARYREFIGKEKIKKKGGTGNNVFVLGDVPVKYDLLQKELRLLVTAERQKDEDARTVYVLVRFLGTKNPMMEQAAQRLILDRYNVRLGETGFVMEDADELLKKVDSYHGMDYEKFVAAVRKELETTMASTAVAIVGEVEETKLDEDADGVTGSCDIKITAYDCANDFKVITVYEGSEVLRRKTLNEAGKLLLEKAAMTSAKAITDSMVKYWRDQR